MALIITDGQDPEEIVIATVTEEEMNTQSNKTAPDQVAPKVGGSGITGILTYQIMQTVLLDQALDNVKILIQTHIYMQNLETNYHYMSH